MTIGSTHLWDQASPITVTQHPPCSDKALRHICAGPQAGFHRSLWVPSNSGHCVIPYSLSRHPDESQYWNNPRSHFYKEQTSKEGSRALPRILRARSGAGGGQEGGGSRHRRPRHELLPPPRGESWEWSAKRRYQKLIKYTIFKPKKKKKKILTPVQSVPKFLELVFCYVWSIISA